NRLFVGPFHTQIDSFITSGESVINNLRYGMNYANQYGKTSKVAYLPDSFGQSQDYPKIFNQLGIDSFVFRRGMGDEHQLPLDFNYQSNDGSSVVATTLNCGYGFATEPFINKCLTENAGLDYDGKDIATQLRKLSDLSTLDGEFLLPIGNDQTPVIWNFKELLDYYSDDENYEFVESTLADYMEKLKNNVENLKTYEGEFINPQYHRVHRSIYSARMDIKILQDKLERMMALEIQPIMTILNDLDLNYDKELINRIWNLLGRSQTHSAATNTDKTNNLILKRTEKAYNLAEALKVYLIRKVAISLPIESLPIVFFNTLPNKRNMILNLEIYTKEKDFSLKYQDETLSYTLLSQEKIYGGVVRKETSHYDESLYFHKSKIVVEIKGVQGFSYNTIYVDEKQLTKRSDTNKVEFIENDYYQIKKTPDAGFELIIKKNDTHLNNFIYLEESGDEGDNYDYSYPTDDMINVDILHNSQYSFLDCKEKSVLEIKASCLCPKDLTSRGQRVLDATSEIKIVIELSRHSDVISIKGVYENSADNHRVRLVVKTPYSTTHSLAGTQFGYIERENNPSLMSIWKEEGWLEEPSPIYPLLNYVMLKEKQNAFGVLTKSSKEYEIVGENYSDIAITLFRSVGHLGLPDLNRRPGRASGIAEKIIPSPQSQMMGSNTFELGVYYTDLIDMNEMIKVYNQYAVEDCYYQHQTFNRVVYPISYFHTNPLIDNIADSYNISIDDEINELAFSTLEIINDKKVLRVFNNGTTKKLPYKITKHDLFGHKISQEEEIRTGEIINTIIE
ncbi:MAG: glycoside hydrolase family 38 C-terminal domain-containing protein, partial [Coprobacillus sp.]